MRPRSRGATMHGPPRHSVSSARRRVVWGVVVPRTRAPQSFGSSLAPPRTPAQGATRPCNRSASARLGMRRVATYNVASTPCDPSRPGEWGEPLSEEKSSVSAKQSRPSVDRASRWEPYSCRPRTWLRLAAAEIRPGTPGITSSRVSTCFASSVHSATVLPSRAASMIAR